MSDNTLGRKRPALSKWFVLVDTDPTAFSSAPVYVSRRQAARSIRYLSSRRRRALELLIASGLLVLLLPLLAMIAVSVRFGSEGPVLFRQKRHGKQKAEFELLKFRSMYCSEYLDPGVTQATRDDPRVTSVGRVLRRTSLDELPQLLNVIKGEMSLIGPRPHAIEHDAFYENIIAGYAERFGAKPGITGLAQVSGARGATPRTEDMQCRINLDIQYLQTACLALDCQILLRTLKEVIGSDTAY